MDRDFERKCQATGLRFTTQRLLVVRALLPGDHPDADELHRRVIAVDPRVSRATVYRTLKKLMALGLVVQHSFSQGRRRYEPARDCPHNHIVDVETGTFVEFFNPDIERAQDLVAAQFGLRLVGSRLVLFAKRLKLRRSKK